MKRMFLFAIVSAVSAVFLSSCEPMDAFDPFGLVHDDDSSKSTSGDTSHQKNESAPQEPSSSDTLSGSWSGRSATGQVSSKLSLRESGGSVSGSLAWPGDTRSVSGTRSGSSVTLHIGGGDTWKLTLSGNKLSGTGFKAGGGTYSCSFSRR